MRPSKRDIIVATRKSPLATVQAEQVGRAVHQNYPKVGMRLVSLESEADRVTDHPLAQLGGKGLFTRAIERAVLDRSADIAVHSLKDLPTDPTPGLVLAAQPRREAVHDVLISADDVASIEDLPQGATVGTCSPRRAAQVLRVRPDIRIVPLRGNVETRLRKVLEERAVDATLLAAAGLIRLGLQEHARRAIPVELVMPAAGQGALAVQCRLDDHTTLRRCMPLNDGATAAATDAERRVVAALGADCHSAVAVLAEPVGEMELRLRARVLSADGRQCVEADRTMPLRLIKQLVRAVTATLIAGGAKRMLAEASATPQEQPAAAEA